MLTAYRILYAVVITVLLGNVLRSQHFSPAPIHSSVLLMAVAFGVCCLLLAALGFSRIPTAVFWPLVLVWEILFIWYAWFSPAAPFALHEVHTLDAATAARERAMHYLWAGGLFALLSTWFLSLPIVRANSR